jgi:hypothetical protein
MTPLDVVHFIQAWSPFFYLFLVVLRFAAFIYDHWNKMVGEIPSASEVMLILILVVIGLKLF